MTEMMAEQVTRNVLYQISGTGANQLMLNYTLLFLSLSINATPKSK